MSIVNFASRMFNKNANFYVSSCQVIIILVLVVILTTAQAIAERRTTKEICLSTFGMDWSTSENAKKYLLEIAKRAAVSELLGEKILSMTQVKNLAITQDEIRSTVAGFLHVSGNPIFYNGTGLGEICVRTEAYITEQELLRFEARKIGKKVCIADPRLSLEEIRDTAHEQARVQAVQDFEPGLSNVEGGHIVGLVHEAKVLDAGFIPETMTYCVEITGTIYPIELMALMETGPRKYKITVSAKKEWVATNIHIYKGQRIFIFATGHVGTLGPSNIPPSGGQKCNSQCTYPQGSFGQLIARIGTYGQIIPFSENLTSVSDTEGLLYLGVNDCCNWSDNQGEFYVQVSIE